ncbi:hypothetical protein CEXT_156161 [Caerostris extrusa]|uniref:Uncharacterized protein n=1 Tax=Caerostris extrusa TaxID=172846 RepID=A0AAV4TSG5_CAEEX|nr:hypothetical protein CEXT_156161 [Caerostris extrusa]
MSFRFYLVVPIPFGSGYLRRVCHIQTKERWPFAEDCRNRRNLLHRPNNGRHFGTLIPSLRMKWKLNSEGQWHIISQSNPYCPSKAVDKSSRNIKENFQIPRKPAKRVSSAYIYGLESLGKQKAKKLDTHSGTERKYLRRRFTTFPFRVIERGL